MCLFCNDIFIDLYRTHVKISEKGGGKKFLSRPCSGYLLKVANKMFNEL